MCLSTLWVFGKKALKKKEKTNRCKTFSRLITSQVSVCSHVTVVSHHGAADHRKHVSHMNNGFISQWKGGERKAGVEWDPPPNVCLGQWSRDWPDQWFPAILQDPFNFESVIHGLAHYLTPSDPVTFQKPHSEHCKSLSWMACGSKVFSM